MSFLQNHGRQFATTSLIVALVALASCGGGDTDATQGTTAAEEARNEAQTPTSVGAVDEAFVVGEPFDLLAGPNRGEARRFDVNVDRPQGVPFAMIRFDPAGSVLAVESADLTGSASEVGPSGCKTSSVDIEGGAGEACFGSEGGLTVVVIPDVGSFRINIPCGTADDLKSMLAAIDLTDVARLAPGADEELPREGPLLRPCSDASTGT